MALSRLFFAAEAFDWVLAVEPWAEAYEIKAGQPVMVEAVANADEYYVWGVMRPDPADGSVTIDVMADERRVLVGGEAIEQAIGPWPS